MAKRLIWTIQANEKRQEIFSYWNNRNQSNDYSRKLNSLFEETAEFLTQHPFIGKKRIERISD